MALISLTRQNSGEHFISSHFTFSRQTFFSHFCHSSLLRIINWCKLIRWKQDAYTNTHAPHLRGLCIKIACVGVFGIKNSFFNEIGAIFDTHSIPNTQMPFYKCRSDLLCFFFCSNVKKFFGSPFYLNFFFPLVSFDRKHCRRFGFDFSLSVFAHLVALLSYAVVIIVHPAMVIY